MSGYLAGKVWHSALEADLKPLAATLADIADDDGSNIYPSVAFVAWRLGRVESCIRDGMRKLREHKILIVMEQGGGRSKPTEYFMDENALPQRQKWVSKPSDNRMVLRAIPSGLPEKPSGLGAETLLPSGEDPSLPVRIDPSEAAPTNSKGQTREEEERFRRQSEEMQRSREDRRARKNSKGRVQAFPSRSPAIVGTAHSVSQPVKPPESWNRYAVEYTRCSDGTPPICQTRDLATFEDLMQRIGLEWDGDPLLVLLDAFRKWAGKQNRWTKWASRDFIETEAWPILETMDEQVPTKHAAPGDVRREAEEFLRKSAVKS